MIWREERYGEVEVEKLWREERLRYGGRERYAMHMARDGERKRYGGKKIRREDHRVHTSTWHVTLRWQCEWCCKKW